MSKIKNGGLDQYGAGPFEQQQFGTAGVEWVKVMFVEDVGWRCQTAVILSNSVQMHLSIYLCLSAEFSPLQTAGQPPNAWRNEFDNSVWPHCCNKLDLTDCGCT